jgi:hypothetical protein
MAEHDSIQPPVGAAPAHGGLVPGLTAEWLSDVLVASGRATGRVTRVEAAPLGVGAGLLSRLERLTLSWADGDGPGSLVVKRPSLEPGARDLARALDLYRREVRFYEQVSARSTLGDLCWYAAFDEDSHDFVLLLDDLAGSDQLDQLAGCPTADGMAVVGALARLHATFWDDAELDDVAWPHLATPPYPSLLADAFRQAWPVIADRWAGQLPAPFVRIGERFADDLPGLMARLSEPPVTLSHGDFRLDNIFVGERVAACDWQLNDRSRGGRDLGCFLSQSLTPATRAKIEADAIDAYVAELARHGVTGYASANAWLDYRLGTLFSLVHPVIGGANLVNDDRSTALMAAMLERAVTAVIDLDCASAL